MAMKNAGDAQSLINTAEGAHNEITTFYNECESLLFKLQF